MARYLRALRPLREWRDLRFLVPFRRERFVRLRLCADDITTYIFYWGSLEPLGGPLPNQKGLRRIFPPATCVMVPAVRRGAERTSTKSNGNSRMDPRDPENAMQ